MMANLKFLKSMRIKNFRHLKKTFTSLKEVAESSSDNKLSCLNRYLRDSLFHLKKANLGPDQINIVESINKSSNQSMILCDDYAGRKSACALGIMNRILESRDNEQNAEHKEDFFFNTRDVFKQIKARSKENWEKRNLKPRGALVICHRFEFATSFYRIFRKLDKDNKLRMVRVGTSLHIVSPSVELDAKAISDSDDFHKEEELMGNINLVNTTNWENTDILFITPKMLEYVLTQKSDYDYFDINPEVILVDDFDYIINSEIYDIKDILIRFFSTGSLFKSEFSNKRKLVLTSSSIPVEKLQLTDCDSNDKTLEAISKPIEFYKNYLGSIHKDYFKNMDIVVSSNFMNLKYHLQGIRVLLNIFDGDGKILFDKKARHLQHLLEHERVKTVICCSDSSFQLLKESLKKRRIKFVSIDENERITSRLLSLLLFNKYEYDILLLTPQFLKSLNFAKLSRLFLFDFISESNDLIRVLEKFHKHSKIEKHHHNQLHLLCSYRDQENNERVIEYLKNHEKHN